MPCRAGLQARWSGVTDEKGGGGSGEARGLYSTYIEKIPYT